jgi:serine/threonine protein kinase
MKSVVSNHASDTADLVGQVADEFLKAIEAGEQPEVEEYAARHPEIAAILRDVLPALTLMNPSRSNGESNDESNGHTADYLTDKTLGDFRLVREIGRGGMGVVYEAEQISLGRTVALKVLPFAAMLDSRQLARFRNEARAAASLHHTNIVPVYFVGSERGVHFYAMQYIRGESLARIVEEICRLEGPDSRGIHAAEPPDSVLLTLSREDEASRRSVMPTLDEPAIPPYAAGRTPQLPAPLHAPRATHHAPRSTLADVHAFLSTAHSTSNKTYFRNIAELGIQAAEALDYAHEQGVVHRDIKPANLLLDDTGRLWIADFGLARLESDAGMTMTGDLVGTLRYMSPEQALAKRVVVDHRTDIYSLGVTLYELLTLRPVFSGEDRHHLLRQITGEEPVPLRKVNRQIPIELETIVLMAIRKNPEVRYMTARDLADDLRSFLANRPIKAKPPTRRELVGKWLRRHPAAIWATILVLLATTITAAASAMFISNSYQREVAARRQADESLNFLKNVLRSPDPRRDGRTITVAELLGRSEKDLQEKFADDPVTKSMLLQAIGESYKGLGLNREAIPPLEQARDLSLGTLGREHLNTLMLMNDLARAFLDAGRIDEATRLDEETLTLRKAELGRDHPDTLASMDSLSCDYFVGSRFEESFRLSEDMFKLRTAKLGPEHPDTLKARVNLTNALEYVRPDEALRFSEETVKLAKANLGPEHPITLIALANTANGLVVAGRIDEGVALTEKALRLMNAKFGPDHPYTLDSSSDLADYYGRIGRIDEARGLAEETVKRCNAKLGPNDPNTLKAMRALAEIYQRARRLDEALSLFEETVNLARTSQNRQTPETLYLMDALTEARLNANRVTDAEHTARECLELRERIHPDDWRAFNTRSLLGYVLLVQKKYAAAEPLLISGYEGIRDRAARVQPGDKPSLHDALERLVQLYKATNQPEKAAAWKAKLTEFDKAATQASPTVPTTDQ